MKIGRYTEPLFLTVYCLRERGGRLSTLSNPAAPLHWLVFRANPLWKLRLPDRVTLNLPHYKAISTPPSTP